MIALPPLDGAVQVTVAAALPAVADTPVGAPGTVAGATGVTEVDAADAGPAPTELIAMTVNVYPVPLVNPVIVVLVPGGVPVIVVAVCAVDPTNGVTV